MRDRTRTRRTRLLAVLLLVVAMITTALVSTASAKQDEPFTLTILHNNDGESQLIDAGDEDFGGVARFATLVSETEKAATKKPKGDKTNRGVILVSSGDNFLAGPEFTAGLDAGTFYDAVALDKIKYDAIALGNHDFDFGPDVLAEFIDEYNKPGKPPYLSANLDFSGEPALQALVDDGVIRSSTIVKEKGEKIGIIGAITPGLGFISSPRNVVVLQDVAEIIQAEIDALEAQGVNKIILISHLQAITEDIALAPLLSGLDVMIAGGGDELLANPGDLLVPSDAEDCLPELGGNPFECDPGIDGDGVPDALFGAYPLVTVNADGVDVPVVTTAGDYKYLGRLEVDFDAAGVVTGWSGGPIRVASEALPDGVKADKDIQKKVVDPVEAYVAGLAANVIATSEVDLEGRRSPGVRTEETNEGNLMADALRWQAGELAATFGVPVPDVGLQNGGGIRNNNVIPAGDFTELNTFEIAPFGNFVAVVPDLDRAAFRQILERAVSVAPAADGRFTQVSGFSFEYDTTRVAQVINLDGTIAVAGDRVTSIVLDAGATVICCDAGNAVIPGAPLTVATIDFSARGGDGYPYLGAPFTPVGASYQQALLNYITGPLGGVISADDYPEGGEGRITDVTP